MTTLHFDPIDVAELLEDSLTWRQLRRLAKKNRLRQYSYLNKRYLAQAISFTCFNRLARNGKSNKS